MGTMNDEAVIVLSEAGLATARRIKSLYPDAEIFGRESRVSDGTVFADTGELVRDLFSNGRPIIGICAAGILIRILAPLLRAKMEEPPVLALSEDGSAVVPLIGGHQGANRLAREIADHLDGNAAITTATDTRFGVSLDDPPDGWVLANPTDAGVFLASLLAGEKTRLIGEADWLENSGLPFDPAGALTIEIGDSRMAGGPDHLVYHRRNLAVGIGCERGAAAAEINTLLRRTLRDSNLPEQAVAGIWSIDVKMDEPGIAKTASDFGVDVRYFTPETLEAETPRLANPSELVFREVGAHGVAEAAALAAAGPAGALIVPKTKSLRATCAIARVPEALTKPAGKRRGRLALVGLGPGAAEWRTEQTRRLLQAADDVVGFEMYLDLIDDLPLRAREHAFPIGAESERVTAALDLAADGRNVALVCSGDAGIYAMAALAFELIDGTSRADWKRVDITVAPGISALQAAAARIGAPIGHDFCTISLSDLLTPWDVIEERVRAAAQGDFIIAFYNPVSRRRSEQLPAARDILLGSRPSTTPVVVARNLGRTNESIDVLELADLTTEGVDMTTVVLVGSSETRRIDRRDGGIWVYSPRGYAAKRQQDAKG